MRRRDAITWISTLAWAAIGDANPCELRTLTFSQTQTGTDALAEWLKDHPPARPFAALASRLLSPPSDRETICKELSELHDLARHRPQRMNQILRERELDGFGFAYFVVGDPDISMRHPMTLRLIRNALHQLAPALFEAKLRHDRVRPSLLDPTLTTAIAVPNHPAYPSGHAAEAGLIAEILSVLSPSHRGIFLSAARRIAVNREIAGLHYRSDSQAGFELARAFVQMAQTEPWFAGLLKYADVEWRAANH